jgi:outer membrane protein assembly factor BamB
MTKTAHTIGGLAITGIFLLSLPASVLNRGIDDWPQWRGRNRDGISTEKGLLKTWPQGGPPKAWQVQGAGEGYSSFAVAQGKLYTLGARQDTEYVMAFDAASGKKLWETPHGSRFSNDQGDGSRGTPVVDGDRIISLGASGDLSSLDAATGKVAWRKNVLQQFGGSNIQWGLSESPLVLEDRILVNAGARGASIVALRKTDGSVLWQSGNDEAGYSSAVLHTVGGVPQAIYFTGERGSASTRAMDGSSGPTTASRTGRRTSPRRSSAATTYSCRRITAPARRCWN